MSVEVKTRNNKRFSTFIKNMDHYGYPVTLTYKNDTEYKSILGGIVTLMFRIIVLTFVIFQMNDIIRKKRDIVWRTVHNNLVKDETPYNLTRDNFDIAWRFAGHTVDSNTLLNMD